MEPGGGAKAKSPLSAQVVFFELFFFCPTSMLFLRLCNHSALPSLATTLSNVAFPPTIANVELVSYTFPFQTDGQGPSTTGWSQGVKKSQAILSNVDIV